MKSLARIVACSALLSYGGVAFAQSQEVIIALVPYKKSGQKGIATLIPKGEKGEQTEIVLKLTGVPEGATQPAHIHDGRCVKLDPKPAIPLQDVVNGSSTTVVDMKLQDIVRTRRAINVHKSTTEPNVYVACGDLKPRS